MTEKAATRVTLDRCRRCGKPAVKDGLCRRCHGTLATPGGGDGAQG